MTRLCIAALSLIFFCNCVEPGYEVLSNHTTNQTTTNLNYIKNFGGSLDDTPSSIIPTNDGGFAIIGYTNSVDILELDKNLTVNDYWILKFDQNANLQWQKSYGGSLDDRGQAIVENTTGGFTLAGYAQSSDGDASNNQGFHDNWLIQVDQQGNLLWEQSFGFAGHDHAYDLLQNTNGELFFTGFLDVSASNGQGATAKLQNTSAHGVGEFWATQLNKQGNIAWRKYFGGSANDRAHAVASAPNGGYVMAGFTESEDFDITQNFGSYDFWVVKIDKIGNLDWQKNYGGSGIDQAQDIIATPDGGYLVVGNTFSDDGMVANALGQSDIWVIKIDANGNLLWQNTYGGSGFDACQSISPAPDGGFIITGNSKSTDLNLTANFGQNDVWIFKIDQQGQLQWQQTFGGSNLDFGYGAIAKTNGEIILIAQSTSTDFLTLQHKGGQDLIVLAFTPN